MNKEERIMRYGKAAYEKVQQQCSDWHAQWREVNPDKVLAIAHEQCRKGGKHYEKRLKYNSTGIQGERKPIRAKHGHLYRPFKKIIAPDSQIHHEWIPGTAKYTGVALVETKPHRYGVIDVIKILEGKITLLSEKEIKEQGGI